MPIDPKNVIWDEQAPSDVQWDEPPKKATLKDDVLRQLGLTARHGVNAVAGIPAMMTDALLGVANLAMPEGKKFKSQSAALNELMTKYGLPESANKAERIVGDVTTSLGTVGSTAGAAYKAGELLKEALASKVGQQAAAAAASSLAGSSVRESGGGIGSQMAAGLIGGAVPLATMAAWRGAFPNTTVAGRFDNKGRLLNEAAGVERDAILKGLDDNKSFLQGERPTAAQAAVDAGSPTFAGIEKVVTKKYKPELGLARDTENEAARLSAVRAIGKGKPELEAAIKAREAAAAPLYQQAEESVMPLNSGFKRLLERPQFQEAVRRAATQAKNEGIDDIFYRDNKGRPTAMIGNGVHYIKKALDETADKTSPAYLGKQAADSALKTRDAFLSIVDKYIPEYGKAKAEYARMSPPVNQMNIGQFLENRLTAPLTGNERPAMFAQSMRDAPGTIKKTTQGPRYESLDQILSKDQVDLLGGVQSSLAREAQTGQQATAGTSRARALIGENFSSTEPPPLLHRAITTTRFLLEKVGVATRNKTLAELARDMQEPTIVAKLMREANPTQKAAMWAVIRAGAPAGLLGATEAQIQ